jgi:predicted O-linked N-acetylglucosamine transferase (SPINDLY family)
MSAERASQQVFENALAHWRAGHFYAAAQARTELAQLSQKSGGMPLWKRLLLELLAEPQLERQEQYCVQILSAFHSALALTRLDHCLKLYCEGWDRGLLWAGVTAYWVRQGNALAANEAEKKARFSRFSADVRAWLALVRWQSQFQHLQLYRRKLSLQIPETLSASALPISVSWLIRWVQALLLAEQGCLAQQWLENRWGQEMPPADALKLGLVLGALYEQQGAFKSALQVYRALPWQPEVCLRQAEVLKCLGQTTDAVAYLQSTLAVEDLAFERDSRFESESQLLAWARLHSQYLICLSSLPETSLDQWQAVANDWAQRYLPKPTPVPLPRYEHQKLRIGYLAPDFATHSIYPLMLTLFAGHDRSHFEIYAYAGQALLGPATEQLVARVDFWRDLSGRTLAEMAEQIKTDQIDILVDAGGHTSLHLLPVFGLRPAPIQISGLCFNGGTGLPCFQYRFTDAICTPPQPTPTQVNPNPIQAPQHAVNEAELLLPSWLFWFPPSETVVLRLPEAGLKMGCAHHPGRLSLAVCQLWAQILAKYPQAQLVLKHRCFASPDTQQVFLDRFAQWGIAAQQIYFEGAAPYREYLAFYNRLHLVLDPFPYHGGLTTAEALWMGRPVLTLGGEGLMRGGMSLLTQLDLTEWLVESESAYLALADTLLEHTWSLEQHQALRAKVERAPFTQPKQLLLSLENCYRLC